MTTAIVFNAFGDIAVKSKSVTSQSTILSEKVSAAKAEARKPANVIPICIVDRKFAGSSTSFSILMASLSPSSAIFRSLLELSEITAISVDAKNAFMEMSSICRIIGPSNGSFKIASLNEMPYMTTDFCDLQNSFFCRKFHSFTIISKKDKKTKIYG